MNDTARDNVELVEPDAIIPPDAADAFGLPPGLLNAAAGMFGIDLEQLAGAAFGEPDPDAPTLVDLLERLDDIDDKLARCLSVLDAARPKLKRLGITWQD